MSAFALPEHQFESKAFIPLPGMYYSAEPAAGGAAVAAPQQQQQQQQRFSSSGAMNPETPQAGNDNLTQLWQAAAGAADDFVPDGSMDPEAEEEQLVPAKKQRKGKAKKGSGRRDLDKLAKQEQRMIKNRESAARSRLRRQQHTDQLEEENDQLRTQVAGLQAQVRSLQTQLEDAQWQLQLSKVPTNAPHSSITVSRTQQTAGICALPPAPSLSLSLPAACSLLLPATIGPEAGMPGQEALGIVDGFASAIDFPPVFTSRRGSSYS